MATRVVLHYGGQEYKLAEGEGDLLSRNPDETGVVHVALANGARLSVMLGPGIHAAVVESEVSDKRPPVVVL